VGDKFKVITEFIKTRDYKLLEERLHDDFLMIREEGLVTKDEFVSYLSGDLEGDNAIILLDYKCLLENEDSLIWQDLFDVPDTGQRIISTSYEAYKEGMVWRSMLNKKIVSKDIEKLL
tara:strand:+ start:195 stop:548 length:354 start_codon:yes stop_codon:yes gene_type:complete